MRACVEFLGDERFGCHDRLGCRPHSRTTCAYAYFTGVSGAAAFLNWKPGWHPDNVDIRTMADDPAAPFQRACAAANYGCEIIHQRGPEDEALFRRRIIESIADEGRPVIAIGVIGPPEACLVTGYDEGGDVLIGWNYYQDSSRFSAGVGREPTGEFRKRDWFANTPTLMLLGQRLPDRPLGEINRETLCWWVEVMRTPITQGDRRNGLAAYSAWADALLDDSAFPAGDEATLRAHHGAHDMIVGNLAAFRWAGARFLTELEVPYSLIEELWRAAACFLAEHALMWQVWDLLGGLGNPQAWERLADPGVRRAAAAVIMQSREQCSEAADRIEGVLARWV